MASQQLTIADLLGLDLLRTEIVAGHQGVGRQVAWAHSCELEEPWKWLAPGDLLMSVGYCVPREAQAQARFVRKLDRAGVVGAMIGRVDFSPEMLAEADRLGFPLMRTEREVPWSAVSRHVAAAAASEQAGQVVVLAHLYERTAAAESAADLATQLAELLGIEFRVVDDASGIAVLSSAHWREAGARSDAPVRFRDFHLSGRQATTLTLAEGGSRGLSAMLLVHLKRVLEVEADRVLLAAEARMTQWQAALDALVGQRNEEPSSAFLPEHAMNKACRVLACEGSAWDLIGLGCSLAELPVVGGRHGGVAEMLVPSEHLERVRAMGSELGVSFGVSGVLDGWSDVQGAAAEARSALRDGLAHGKQWAEYAGKWVSVLARSEREAREAIATVLGPLMGADERVAVLRETLFSYLRHDRSWNTCAEELGIHRQTLAYRLRKIESLTGRSLASTADLAALWIATEAWDRFGDVEDISEQLLTDP